MKSTNLKRLNDQQTAQRQCRVAELAKRFGFTGIVEYRHVLSRSGGAQFFLATEASSDCLLIYAEAFERDRDPEEFNLSAIIAHECGHQRLLRDPKLEPVRRTLPGVEFEEVLASLIGARLVDNPRDIDDLRGKAAYDLSRFGLSRSGIESTIEQLDDILKEILS